MWTKRSVNMSSFPSVEFKNEEVHSQIWRFRYLFGVVQVCSVHAVLLVSICRYRKGKSVGPLLFIRTISLFPRLVPHEQSPESHIVQSCRKNWGCIAIQHRTVLKEHGVFHTPTIYGTNVLLIRCFPAGKVKTRNSATRKRAGKVILVWLLQGDSSLNQKIIFPKVISQYLSEICSRMNVCKCVYVFYFPNCQPENVISVVTTYWRDNQS